MTIDHVWRHLELEGALTDELLRSHPGNRHETFSKGYRRLYAELPWLNGHDEEATREREASDYRRRESLLQPIGRVYEIGSGGGNFARFLARRGYEVTATEITDLREAKDAVQGLTWHQTHGVVLARYERPESFDYVVSDQVFEHLHPDDHLVHVSNALALLKPNGSYVLRAPHASGGPLDITLVFPRQETPVYMHLGETSYSYLADLMKRAGFRTFEAVWRIPGRRPERSVVRSKMFLQYQILAEQAERIFVRNKLAIRKLRTGRLRSLLRIDAAVWLVATK